MVVALVERGQVRELQKLHDAAGVTAASDEVAAGHHVVREIATSGTPVPPPPAVHPLPARSNAAPARHPGNSRRPARPAAAGRDGYARSTANPGRRPQNAYRSQGAHRAQGPSQAQDAKKSA